MNRQTLITLPLLTTLAACGGSGSTGSGPLPAPDDAAGQEFNPDGPVVNAGSSPYYRELVGTYDGQITFEKRATQVDEIPVPCVWEVEIQVTGDYDTDPTFRQVYDLRLAITSDLVSGDDDCRDIGAGADVIDALGSFRNVDLWAAPPWPVDASASFYSDLPSGFIHPVGREFGGTNSFDLQFDGRGNVYFPQILDAGSQWSGVMVKS